MNKLDLSHPTPELSDAMTLARHYKRERNGFPECRACLNLAEYFCCNCGRFICDFHMHTPDLHGQLRCYGCDSTHIARLHTKLEIEAQLALEEKQ